MSLLRIAQQCWWVPWCLSICISHGRHDKEDNIVTFEAMKRVMNEGEKILHRCRHQH